MEFFSTTEIFLSIIYSFIFGFSMGMIFVAISVLTDSSEQIIKMPKEILRASTNLKILKLDFKQIIKSDTGKNKIKIFVKDGLCTLIYGVGFSILLYIATDGQFRIYILIISLSSTYIFYKYLGKFVEMFFCKFLRILCSFIILFFAVIISPFLKFVKKGIFMFKNQILCKKKRLKK